jgi:DNA mismatch repair protein MSH6
MRILKNAMPTSSSVMWNALAPNLEFWDAETTMYELEQGEYFKDEQSGSMKLPATLEQLRTQDLAVSAFGGMVWYLRSVQLKTLLVIFL